VDERYNAVQGSDVEAAWAEHLRHSEAADAARRGAHEEATLEGAQRIAREFHLLRKAVQLPSSARSRAHKLRADARDDASARDGANELERFAAAVVRDAAAGRTLLESEALAAAEVAHQLRLPLRLVIHGVAPSAEDRQTSWFSAAHARLDELRFWLEAAQEALRTRVASEGGGRWRRGGAVAAAGHDPSAAELWALRAAGVSLSNPKPLVSVYGPNPLPTHAVPRYANTLDWICVDSHHLDVVGVAPLPPVEELTRHVAMPSVEWPSDHVSLCCDLAWRE
jgi:2',5'-phosphodiesterase